MKNNLPTNSKATFAWTAVLTILLALFAFITVLTQSKSESIKTNIAALQLEKDSYHQIDTCISILYSAENNSRFFVVTQDSAYLKAYTRQLQTVNAILQQYQNERENREKKLYRLISKKQRKNQEFVNLRLIVDSLLTFSLSPEEITHSNKLRPAAKVQTSTRAEAIDSTEITPRKTKRKLVKRLMDAIRDEQPAEKAILKTHTNTIIRQDSVKVVVVPAPLKNQASIEKARRELGKAEQQLLAINSLLFANLQKALQDIKNREKQDTQDLRSSLLTATQVKSEEMNLLMWAAVPLVFLLAVVIIFNLVKLYKKDATILSFARMTADSSKSKGDFLAQITHELRTPLNAIIGFSNLIEPEKLDEDMKVNVNSIKSASQIMLSLVNEILDFSKFESGTISLFNEPFKPAELVQQSVSLLSVLAAEKHIGMKTQLDMDNSIALLGDNFRIRQVVINLVTNAIKFTPENGSIDVKARFENATKEKGILVISIKDSGVGIARENLSSIFDDFIQVSSGDARARQGGTGLGLSICKRIVDLYGGKISVTSVLGVGSEFTVRIPLKITEHSSRIEAKPLAKLKLQADLRDKKLLIADDTKMNLILISRIMDKLGATYDLAENGQQAFDLFEINTYDLVITDIDMPVMDGVELTKRIRSHQSSTKAGLPVIGFTGYTEEEKLAGYRAVGMDEILPKPFEESNLIAVLSSYLTVTGARR
ncbi:ATP-binding protein [Dyadobacter sp. CY343]|uniref:ATP-binding response regulator n=1 Tax=Dyadobacter sp. CY343 TaxID=2907299 RepID=UPI001F1C7919|nr:ATP-binding protein [Dyadobacter sp. CY343]MCE7060239.1 ATP-binding protein [Dyadobacter sp. CY343]